MCFDFQALTIEKIDEIDEVWAHFRFMKGYPTSKKTGFKIDANELI